MNLQSLKGQHVRDTGTHSYVKGWTLLLLWMYVRLDIIDGLRLISAVHMTVLQVYI